MPDGAKNNYIVCISVGPVQGFIAAARRTRDLWFGSYLLSEISKAIALDLYNNSAKIIFPNSTGVDLKQDSDLNVANVILFEYEAASQDDIKALLSSAKEAGHLRWKDFADKARHELRGFIDEERWDSQEKDVLEFYAAWCPRDNTSKTSYVDARRRVMRILSGRKNIRDFAVWNGQAGIPKSSLDGARESVLNGRECCKKNLRIKQGEALDILGAVKRAATREGFPSVSRVAANSFIENANNKHPDLIAEISEYAKKLLEKGLISGVKHSKYDTFLYDAAPFFLTRYDEFAEEKETADRMRSCVKKLVREFGEPTPYFAFIAADGDRMGAAISAIDNADDHRLFSRILSRFASYARKIVECHNGVLVYSGGDDVLAYLPLENALPCARALRDIFVKLWSPDLCVDSYIEGMIVEEAISDSKVWSEKFRQYLKENPDLKSPTLSVGVSIAHCMENMADLLNFAREAEQDAKSGKGEKSRNGFAISVRSRSNSVIKVREQWADFSCDDEILPPELDEMPLDKRIIFWTKHFSKKNIPAKFPYELREAAEFYKGWKKGEVLTSAMQKDLIRIFDRKDLNLGRDKFLVENYIKNSVSEDYNDIILFADELITAQWIAEAGKLLQGGKDNAD